MNVFAGVKSPRIVQEGVDQAMTLGLVACRDGFAFVAGRGTLAMPSQRDVAAVVDLNFPIPIYLIWRKDISPVATEMCGLWVEAANGQANSRIRFGPELPTNAL